MAAAVRLADALHTPLAARGLQAAMSLESKVSGHVRGGGWGRSATPMDGSMPSHTWHRGYDPKLLQTVLYQPCRYHPSIKTPQNQMAGVLAKMEAAGIACAPSVLAGHRPALTARMAAIQGGEGGV
jgi:hypothetical protein